MNNEQNNHQNDNPVQAFDTQVAICETCAQNPCICPNKEVKQEDSEQQSDKKPPKIRWI